MRSITNHKAAVSLIGGIALAGALAGCSASTTPTAEPTTDSASSAAPAPATTGTATGTYKDGTYKESATYSAPSGTETIDVTLTLAGDVITAVQVTGEATDPQAKRHQGEFSDGIAAVVVGKSIDEISVDKVGGSSLTSSGFNKAVDAIKADAS